MSKPLTEAQKEERRIARLIKRINYRMANPAYLETVAALDAKRQSEGKGRYGRGDSVFDERMTHGVIEEDRNYHGCANPLDPDDDGDVDAWKYAD